AKRPEWAAHLENRVKYVAVALLFILIVGAMIKSRKELAMYGLDAIVPPVLLSLSGLALGALAAIALNLRPRQRVTTSLEVGTQNAALAIGLALTSMQSNDAAFPGVVYGTFMYFPCGVVVWLGRQYLARALPPSPPETP
ncbi:MAG: hypothetical protein AAFS10_19150, partial [Myxococcota bacterium]